MQWMERTLDDSAGRHYRRGVPRYRCHPGHFAKHVAARGLDVHDKVIARRIRDELPFMATEFHHGDRRSGR
jgi:hypothetical protein